MINILDLGRHGIEKILTDLGEKPYRTSQVFQWIYQKGITDFSEMVNIAKPLRDNLAKTVTINYPQLIERKISTDTTEKLAYRLSDGGIVESVLIPEEDHWTLCVSTQLGCAMGCKFCCTATLGFVRNLTTGEIVSQVIYPIKHFTDKNITNVVFMGMGEPLLNYENLINAISILRDDLGPGLSRRKITVSTCGIVPGITSLYHNAEVGLAVSLNAATDEVRNKIMPINKKYPVKELVGALKRYPLPKRSRITIEYVLLKGVNDRINDAKALLKTLTGTKMKINLIVFNPWPGSPFEAPRQEDVLAFQKYLRAHHGGVMIRKERGKDIMAACGQLAGGKK